MELILRTIVIGIFVALLWKISMAVLKYIDLCRKLRKIPQKKSHWLLGHCKEVTDSTSYMDYAMDVMKSGAKVYCEWNGPIPVVGVCHPDTFKQLIKQELNKARGISGGYRFIQQWIGEGLLISADRKWERNRRLLTPAFHFDILSGYVKVMNDTTNVFLDKLEEASQRNKTVELSPFVCRETLDAMLKCSLSYDGSMQEETEHKYIKAIQRMSTLLWKRMVNPFYMFDTIYNLSPIGRESSRLIDEMQNFTGGLIKRRQRLLKEQPDLTKHKRRLDFLDILLTAKDEQGHGLSPQEIQDEVDTFTFEGHDTTGSAISWAIYALGQYPEVQEQVYKDVTTVVGEDDDVDISQNDLNAFQYLPIFIKEVMRFYSPVPLISRGSSKELIIDGKKIPPGLRIDIVISVLHHHPEIWKNPEVFNPERFDSDHRDETSIYGFIPFSAGSRNCIGQIFAMNEIKINLAKLVKRFKVLPVKGHVPEFLPDVVMRSLNGLPVILERRR